MLRWHSPSRYLVLAKKEYIDGVEGFYKQVLCIEKNVVCVGCGSG